MNGLVSPLTSRIHAALQKTTHALLAQCTPKGHWEGHLSSSALSTATAVFALHLWQQSQGNHAYTPLIQAGLQWLAAHQNPDGGWGDTTRSLSNVSTTALVWSAFGGTQSDAAFPRVVSQAQSWLERASHSSGSGWEKALAQTIRRRYGKDHTFSVPILMTCALAGRLGPDAWREIPALPFELAALPHGFYGMLQLPVVSYALPALIAIGQLLHHQAPSRNPLARGLRSALRRTTLRVLKGLQPPNGGFLEATPLTSFVLMSLAAMHQEAEGVASRAAQFLCASVRSDGSWPIDSNLATWVSTWAIQALRWQPGTLAHEQRASLRAWLLAQQLTTIHPYTHAAPGGWAWTDLPGGVPDADDTPGAMLALLELGPLNPEVQRAGDAAAHWLIGLQNRDGGIPTFCRGWGALPFDRSSPDLTAHALRAWSAWLPHWNGPFRARVERAMERALAYLQKTQAADGSWAPLWFGNEHVPDEANRTYGTARTLLALRELKNRGFSVAAPMLRAAEHWLVQGQLADGGWGGGHPHPSTAMQASVEETSLAVEALAGTAHVEAFDRGVAWLLQRVEDDRWQEAAPIGFYFAKLWYFETLYPFIHCVAALGAAARVMGRSEPPCPSSPEPASKAPSQPHA